MGSSKENKFTSMWGQLTRETLLASPPPSHPVNSAKSEFFPLYPSNASLQYIRRRGENKVQQKDLLAPFSNQCLHLVYHPFPKSLPLPQALSPSQILLFTITWNTRRPASPSSSLALNVSPYPSPSTTKVII